MNGSRMRTFLVVPFLATALILTWSSPAVASHGSALPDPDNTTQCVKSPSIVAESITARNQGFAQQDRTAIDTQYCTGDDIWVQDYTYGNTGWYGATTCDDRTLSGRCDIYIVKFNETFYPGLSTNKLKSLGCHEFGHTGSVTHRFPGTDADDNSCMRGTAGDDVWYLTYDAHDISSINGGL